MPPVEHGGMRFETAPDMKKPNQKTKKGAAPRIHTDREDRARTNAGKTVNSKVRSEGRTLAARERDAITARAFHAAEAKSTITE